jgi:hypothetical protein
VRRRCIGLHRARVRVALINQPGTIFFGCALAPVVPVPLRRTLLGQPEEEAAMARQHVGIDLHRGKVRQRGRALAARSRGAQALPFEVKPLRGQAHRPDALTMLR